jgi:hypothetical protein
VQAEAAVQAGAPVLLAGAVQGEVLLLAARRVRALAQRPLAGRPVQPLRQPGRALLAPQFLGLGTRRRVRWAQPARQWEAPVLAQWGPPERAGTARKPTPPPTRRS